MKILRRPWGLLGAFLILLMGAAFLTQVVPYGQIVDSKREVAEAQQHLELLEEENAVLQDDVDALYTETEIEKLAREKLGYVRPGETAYVVLDPPGTDDPTQGAPPPAPEPEPTWVDKVWAFLTGADAED